MKKLFVPLFFVIVILSGCDKIDDPIPDDFVSTEGISWDDSLYTESSPTMRKILIEEFTGQLCTYCPDGAREIERLDSIYGSQLIPVSFHAGGFANPSNGAPNDFRTPTGDTYFSTFGVSSNPAATVSRINNANITGLSQWEPDIISIKNDVPKVSIGLSVLYDDSTRTAKAVVNTKWLSTETGNFNLQIYMLEDSIVAWQLDNSVPNPNYIHRHMFRKVFNGTWGTAIPSSNNGDEDTQEYALELPPEWDKNHCIVVAHVYKTSPDYEILQGEELHLIAP